ncbi:MAG: transposase [Myxococcales bacterium]|nr:transposase [Myxococcales bacterium]
MLSLPPSVKVFAAVGPVDMRKGVDALASVVRHVIRQEPMSNHLFVFRGRRGHMLRVLFSDRNGWALYSKRLKVGNFHLPVEVAEGTHRVEVDAAELMLMLEGIDLRGAKRYARWRPPTAENDGGQTGAKA